MLPDSADLLRKQNPFNEPLPEIDLAFSEPQYRLPLKERDQNRLRWKELDCPVRNRRGERNSSDQVPGLNLQNSTQSIYPSSSDNRSENKEELL